MEDEVRHYKNQRLSMDEVLEQVMIASKLGKPYSIARFGHGEIFYANGPHQEDSDGMYYYKKYNGGYSSEEFRQSIIESIQNTDIAGLFMEEEDEKFAKDTQKLLTRFHIFPGFTCSPFITHQFLKSPLFWEWLKSNRVILVGRRAKEAIIEFEIRGIEIVDTMPLEGFEEMEKVKNQLGENADNWDIALISAGVPASILAPQLAKATSNVAIDFGHALDIMITGDNFDHELTVQEFLKSKK